MLQELPQDIQATASHDTSSALRVRGRAQVLLPPLPLQGQVELLPQDTHITETHRSPYLRIKELFYFVVCFCFNQHVLPIYIFKRILQVIVIVS